MFCICFPYWQGIIVHKISLVGAFQLSIDGASICGKSASSFPNAIVMENDTVRGITSFRDISFAYESYHLPRQALVKHKDIDPQKGVCLSAARAWTPRRGCGDGARAARVRGLGQQRE